MALTDNVSLSDIAAVTRGNYGGFGDFGFGGGQGWWVLLLFLFAMNGGWGNGGFGGGNGAIPFMMANNNTNNDVQRGFDQQALMAGIGNLNNAVSNGFANAQANLLQTLNQNQNATTAGISDLKYTVATEACADRQAVNNGARDIIDNQNSNANAIITSINNGIQSITDKLCQLELDNVKRENEQLRSQLNMAALAASQSAQTAQLIQDNNAQTAALINRIAPAPVPSYNVPNPYVGYGYGCAGCGAA